NASANANFSNDGTISGSNSVLISVRSDPDGANSVGTAAVSNGGTISGNNLTISVSGVDCGSASFINNGTIKGDQLNLTEHDNNSSCGSVSFVNSNSGTITDTGSGGSGQISFSGQSFDNEGTIAVTGSDTFNLNVFASSTAVNNGTISVGPGGRLIFSGTLGGS